MESGAASGSRYEASVVDALTPPDRSTQYWILSDDAQIRYGNALAEISSFSQATSSVGELRIGGRTEPMLIRCAYFPADERHAELRFIVAIDSESYARTRRAFRSVLLASVSGGVLLVALIGYLITHWGLVRSAFLKPVRRWTPGPVRRVDAQVKRRRDG